MSAGGDDRGPSNDGGFAIDGCHTVTRHAPWCNGAMVAIRVLQAVACAVQNLHLSATAYGACGYWSSGAITYLDDTREALGLDTKDRVLGFFYLGLPETEIKEGVRNSPYTDKIEWVEE